LSKRGDSKPLVPLLGLPLIERVILTANKAGLTEFCVVTGHNNEDLERQLTRFSHDRNIGITSILNKEWQRDNGLSVLKAKQMLEENFILLMGDHIFDETLLVKLKNEKVGDGEVVLAVDNNIETNGLVDVDDVTKVLVKGDRILDIGKNIKKYNAYDTGIFLCSPAIFKAIEETLSNDDTSLTGGLRILAKKGKAKAFDVKDDYWVDVDDENSYRLAEDKLLSTLKKPSDGPVSRYLNRPISTRISKRLVKTGISPNSISFFSFFISMLGAFFFFLGGYANLVIGGILAQLSSVVDGCDGEVARLKFQETEFGGWFDSVLDRYADGFLLFGLTYYVYLANNNFLYITIGFLAIIGAFMNSYTADKYDSLMRNRLGSNEDYFRIGRDVRVFIIFLGALANQVVLTLVLIAAMTNAENIRRIVVLNRDGKSGLCKKRIEGIIERSRVPEDTVHAKNTLEWLLKLKPDADEALKIAAYGHDIERAIENRKVRRKEYKSYDDFKKGHALNSANILKEIMDDCNVRRGLVNDVFNLVCHHETGGDGADVLSHADSISFFQVNLPYYFVRNSLGDTKRRFIWGYKRLPDNLKRVVAKFDYQDIKLDSLVRTWIPEPF
jgi:CDP-L-myo-inositol myo-inositolphosphotransferase